MSGGPGQRAPEGWHRGRESPVPPGPLLAQCVGDGEGEG